MSKQKKKNFSAKLMIVFKKNASSNITKIGLFYFSLESSKEY